MNRKTRRRSQRSFLRFYWVEIKASENARATWGQLVESSHRLAEIRDDLSTVAKQRDVVRRLRRATNVIEEYLHRAYELRERAVQLLGVVTGKPNLAKKAKKPQERMRSLEPLRPLYSDLVDHFKSLLLILDNDMLLRNKHTHLQFLRVCFYGTPYSLCEPEDALRDCEGQPARRRQLESLLRTEIRRLVKKHQVRILRICSVTRRLANAADPHIRRPS